ncbi:hypothetical protein FRC05_009994 [Tulasnella sp. 425]|nr:hypothetical protein FRC05_009994 [Tulasnella sp. 425]
MAKSAGRLRDNNWIIEEVYTSLAGDALRWYIELDDDIRNDWLRLQRAIMQKYPPPSQRSLRNNATPQLNNTNTRRGGSATRVGPFEQRPKEISLYPYPTPRQSPVALHRD